MHASRSHLRAFLAVPSLATANLRHDWILTLCLVIALAAVIAPLLVLLGLKHGTIETLRERLVEDPVFRELRPAQTREFAPEWFAATEGWPEIAFLTPTILPLSSVIHVALDGSSEGSSGSSRGLMLFDLVPTAANDPLLIENGAPIPQEEECVLSAEAARLLGVGVGDEIETRVTRSRGGRTEVAEARLRVAGVMDARGGTLARIYAPLDFVLDVEAYKEGYGAPQRGWAGDSPEPYLSFDGVILLLPEALQPIARTGLIINTGFARLREVSHEEAAQRLGFKPPLGLHAYDLASPGSAVTLSSIRAVEQKLRGFERVLLPYVSGLELRTAASTGFDPIGLSLDARQAGLLGLPASPWGGFTGSASDGARLTSVLLPAGSAVPQGRTLQLDSVGVLPLTLSLTAHPSQESSPLDRAMVPIELLGVLRTATQRGVSFDPERKQFLMARGGYRGFRMYAKSIDDVPLLFERLRNSGVEVLAEVEAIERIQVLDLGLTRLFWLIAALSIGGGTAVLIASLYAAVERLRRDLGVLRLVGLARLHVFFFPVVQGCLIAALGLAAGFGGYAALAGAINRTFADDLEAGQRFCALPGELIPLLVAVTLALAIAASLVAAWRTTRIDPAEAIREQ